MKPSEILREAVKLDWTQGVFARDSTGFPVEAESSAAVCFCAVGRINRLTDGDEDVEPRCYLARTIDIGIVAWNDAPGRTREEVDAVFLRAAELAESEGR